MNIFEYLGLSADHRKAATKTTQLVKHFDEVIDKHKTGKTFGIQVKSDGVCALTVVNNNSVAIYSRTGKRFTNTGYIEARIFEQELRDGVYFGELCAPRAIASLEEVSGITNPNRKEELTTEQSQVALHLEMHYFDYVSIASFIEGVSQTKYYTRYNILRERVFDTKYIRVIPYIIASPVQHHKIDECLRQAIEDGEEGIVVCDLSADWIAGHKGWRKMKKVRGVDYDLECIGFEEGTGKYTGKVANLIFRWKDGKNIKAMLGKGWTHLAAQEMYESIRFRSTPIGKIFQVYALQESSKGKLRLPKVGELRHDKDKADV